MIRNNRSSQFYQNGISDFGEKSILVGMSPGNGFFSEQNMTDILLGMCKLAPEVYIVIPDEPHIHNFIGMGYSAEKAKKKAKRDITQIHKRMQRVVDALANKTDNVNYSIIDWRRNIEMNNQYQSNYTRICNLYNEELDFQNQINQFTYQYLEARAKVRTVNNINVAQGVKYYLKELALFSAMPSIFGESPIVAYYKEFSVGLDFITKLFNDFSENFSLIQYSILPKDTA